MLVTYWYKLLNSSLFLQLFDTMREQDLLFPDFSDGGIETEDGIEFNKVLRWIGYLTYSKL